MDNFNIPTRYKLIFVILVMVIIAGGCFYHQARVETIRKEKYDELTTINKLKSAQIVNWKRERLTIARSIQQNPLIIKGVSDFVQNRLSSYEREKFIDWIEHLIENFDYEAVHIFTPDGRIVHKSGNTHTEPDQHIYDHFQEAFETKEVYYFDLHKDEKNYIHLDISIPVLSNDHVIAVMVVIIDPNQFLYPLIQTWPTASYSAETILAKKDGDSVLILNELRHQKNTALNLYISSDRDDIALVKATKGFQGLHEGPDYRGIAVLAAVSKLPETDWFLSTKIDVDEIYEDMYAEGRIIIAFVFLFIFASGSVVYSMARHQRAAFFATQLELEQKRTALTKHYEYLTRHANDIILLIDDDGRIIEANQKAIDTYGYSREELFGMSAINLRVPEQQSLFRKQLNQVEKRKGMVFETVHKKKDGTQFPVETSIRFIQLEGKNYFQAINRDITERKEAEEKIKRANRLYAVLSQVNQAIVRVTESDLLFDEICRIMIEYGKFRLAWIGLINHENKIVKPVTFAGYNDGYLEKVLIKTTDEPEGRGPSGRAIRTKTCIAVNDIKNNPDFDLWQEEASKRGYNSSISAPFSLNNIVLGILSVYASEVDFFDEEEVSLFSEISRDISFALEVIDREAKRKTAEKELAEKELRYRTVFNATNDAMLVLDQEKIIDCNERSMKMFGCSRNEIISKNPFDFSPIVQPDGRESVESGMEKITGALNGKPQFFDWKHKNFSGILFDTEVSLIRFELSGKDYLLGVVHDISARKKAEESLRFQNMRNRLIFNTAGDGFHVINRKGKILEVNKSFSEMLGYSQPELTKLSIMDLDVQWTETQLLERVNELMAKGRGIFETKHRHKDGVVRDLEIRASHFNFDNEDYLFCSARDITERKQAESELRKMYRSVEQSPASIIITDTNGIIQYVNPKMCEVSGYSKEELIGKKPSILKSGETSEAEYKKLWESISSGSEWRGEFHNKRKDGSLYWEAASISPIDDAEGNITHFIAVKEDITDKKHLEQELINAKERAEEISRLKSIFLANMSHELRTPMIGILGYAEMLESELSQTEYKEMASVILHSGKRLNDTLNSILDLSKIESDRFDIRNQKVNLNESLYEIEKLYKIAAFEKGLHFSLILPDKQIYGMVDKDILLKVVSSLVQNAIKYTDEGSVKITLSAEDGKAIISVSDTGIGISEEYLPLIFEPFRQVSEGMSRGFEGTGLGLTITKRFIELMNGRINVSSKAGKGSTFVVSFDMFVDDTVHVENELSGKPDTYIEPLLPQRERKPKILLVEDDDISVIVISKYLKAGYDLDIIGDGKEAVNLASQKSYDGFLMDIALKGEMSGMDVVEALRNLERYKSTPIIAVTAYAMEGDREKILSSGCSHYISKPFGKNQLLEVLDSIFV